MPRKTPTFVLDPRLRPGPRPEEDQTTYVRPRRNVQELAGFTESEFNRMTQSFREMAAMAGVTMESFDAFRKLATVEPSYEAYRKLGAQPPAQRELADILEDDL